MDITPRRRRALATALAFVLAIESVSAVAAAAQVSVASRGAPGSFAGVAAARAGVAAAHVVVDRLPGPAADASIAPQSPPASMPRRPVAQDRPALPPAKTSPAKAAPTATAKAPSTVTAKAPSIHSSTIAFVGRNHVWIPLLGIDRSVSPYACREQHPPDNFVYRWGCAGTNNVYLLGHAYSVFKPLHDAYVSHRLKVGLTAYYADARGTVHVYAVTWWRITLPTPGSKWAWAPQSTPSMTLQTCVGAHGEYRLMVRLVEVGG
jgi:Sortase domain